MENSKIRPRKLPRNNRKNNPERSGDEENPARQHEDTSQVSQNRTHRFRALA